MHCVECDASPVGGKNSGHRPVCTFSAWPTIKARIEQDRAIIADLLAALKPFQSGPWGAIKAWIVNGAPNREAGLAERERAPGLRILVGESLRYYPPGPSRDSVHGDVEGIA
jgi:hypothetical protein